jgi:hypothetical protein
MMPNIKEMSEMKTYRGMVIATYWEMVTVEAEDADEAEQKMQDEFSIISAHGEMEVSDLREWGT